jgi:1-deoxy-D-xylulose-5-phosphate synthase
VASTFDQAALTDNGYELREPVVEGTLSGPAPSSPSGSEVLPCSVLDRIAYPADLRALRPHQLPVLCEELREELIHIVSKTGGHLGAGLGVVELTVALHRVFDTPVDKLIWDVSHQCYPHKILTGRRVAMSSLRKGGGPSGFTCRSESDYDPFGAAHSSTAISSALGFATARDLAGGRENVVAVVGDGAMSGGMAFEGLNNLGAQRRRMIIVLNDNNMSIAPPSGSLAHHLAGLRGKLVSKYQRGDSLRRGLLQSYAGAPTLFDRLGVRYVGPYDGHDVAELVDVFEIARAQKDGPILIHVLTQKGHGYAPAEASKDCMHGVSGFEIRTGKQKKAAPGAPSYTSVFAGALIEEARRDERIVAITAAMPSGTGLDKFGKEFPDRCFDAGIAEQHAVTFCAGLACEGFKPFAAIYSTFLQRAYDQVVHDVAIQRLPVRFAIDRAGFVGADGVTHQGSYDIAYLGCLPGFVLMAAADEAELVHMVATAAAIDDRPSALRYPRGEGRGVALPERGCLLEIGKGRIVREGERIAILSYGAALAEAFDAAARLDEMGLTATIADARFAKPVDDDLIARLVCEHKVVLTLEHGSIGGFSAQVFDSLRRQRLGRFMSRVIPFYLPDCFIYHDAPSAQTEAAGLDGAAIAEAAKQAIGLGVRNFHVLGVAK